MTRPLPQGSAEVLLVEDDDELREILADILRQAGHSVLTAVNGQEALVYLAGNRLLPSLIILDLNLPVMDGHELLALVRSYKRLSAIPVIVISGLELNEEQRRMARVYSLRKPLDTPTFLRMVETALPVAA